VTANPPALPGRRIALALWPVLLAWGGWVAARAYGELTAIQVVDGPDRTWRSPSPTADGWLLDPRPGPLAAELRDRFRPDAPVPATDDPRAALTALGLGFRETRGLGDGYHECIVLTPAPLLVVGYYGRDPIVFDPARGVVRLHAGSLGDDLPAIELTEAHEAPW
jgi:hypothetical protein